MIPVLLILIPLVGGIVAFFIRDRKKLQRHGHWFASLVTLVVSIASVISC